MGSIASDFTSDQTVSYNGYTFDPSMLTVSVKHTPRYDDARRTAVATRHEFVISAILQAADQTDGTKTDTSVIRQQLLVPGGAFVYSNCGIGDFSVNVPVGNDDFLPVRDCSWGPIPELLSHEDYGNGKAGKITLKLTCETPEQCADPAYTKQLMAFNYKYSVEKDLSGYSTRTSSGYVEIPITRNSQNDRTIPDTVDRLKENCYPDVPIGFRRDKDNWNVSLDRKRADFTFVDIEMPPTRRPPMRFLCRPRMTWSPPPRVCFNGKGR